MIKFSTVSSDINSKIVSNTENQPIEKQQHWYDLDQWNMFPTKPLLMHMSGDGKRCCYPLADNFECQSSLPSLVLISIA